ncbi:MAG: septation inhibitor protein [Micrococcales bacterium 73-13]|nr:MAG: septation inhibitor protein [Micrococcales bacterium 73-13]
MARTRTDATAKQAKAVAKAERAERAAAAGERAPNPVWFKPVMFGFMLLGLAWLLTYYISDSRLPIVELGNANIAIGIGIMLVGFLMTTRWR